MALWPCPPCGHQHLMELLSSLHLQVSLTSTGLGEALRPACSLFSVVNMRHCCMETALQLDLLIKSRCLLCQMAFCCQPRCSTFLLAVPAFPFSVLFMSQSLSAPLSLPNLPVSPFVSLFVSLSHLLPTVSIPLSLQGTGTIANSHIPDPIPSFIHGIKLPCATH